MNNKFLICPDDCSTATLPAFGDMVKGCYPKYNGEYAAIGAVLIVPPGADDPFVPSTGSIWGTAVDADLSADFDATAIDNTAGDNSKSVILYGFGGVEIANETIIELPFRQRRKEKTYRLSIDIPFIGYDSANQHGGELYDFLRTFQCTGNADFKFYYFSDVFVYGITLGLDPETSDVILPKDKNREARDFATLTIDWTAQADAERRLSPL